MFRLIRWPSVSLALIAVEHNIRLGFLFFNIIVSSLNVFIIVYAYSLNFFPKKWRKKVNQDTLVGLALIFITMLTMFSWIIYLYLKIFNT